MLPPLCAQQYATCDIVKLRCLALKRTAAESVELITSFGNIVVELSFALDHAKYFASKSALVLGLAPKREAALRLARRCLAVCTSAGCDALAVLAVPHALVMLVAE
jgi:hypothetical protein